MTTMNKNDDVLWFITSICSLKNIEQNQIFFYIHQYHSQQQSCILCIKTVKEINFLLKKHGKSLLLIRFIQKTTNKFSYYKMTA